MHDSQTDIPKDYIHSETIELRRGLKTHPETYTTAPKTNEKRKGFSMNKNNSQIKELISDLEDEINLILNKKKKENAEATDREYKEETSSTHKTENRERASHPAWIKFKNTLSLPFIYGMFFPLILLDVSVSLYQAVCFRLYGIPRVKKADYIALERHNLGYLNPLEKINCDYCGYANGMIAFTREIFARTEQYFCPIKHAHKVLGTHQRYAEFLKYGEAEGFHRKLDSLRKGLSEENP